MPKQTRNEFVFFLIAMIVAVLLVGGCMVIWNNAGQPGLSFSKPHTIITHSYEP